MIKKIKIILDVLMLILLILLNGYNITGNKIHEVLGILTFILFLLHLILNFKWINVAKKNISKLNKKGKILFICSTLLFISMILMIISSVVISSFVFDFLNIKTTSFFRKLHIFSTSWLLILISIHLELNTNSLIKRIKRISYYIEIIFIPIILIGLYNYIKFKLYNDMLFITEFKFIFSSENPILFYLSYLSIILAFCLITNKISIKK